MAPAYDDAPLRGLPLAAAWAVLLVLAAAAAWVWVSAARAFMRALRPQPPPAVGGGGGGEGDDGLGPNADFRLLPPEARSVPERMRRRASCFSCETQEAREREDEAWRAQPSKCFSCQEELARLRGDAAGFYGS